MARRKSVRTDRVWLRDDFNDRLDQLDQEQKLGIFLIRRPTGRPSKNICGRNVVIVKVTSRNTASSTMRTRRRPITSPCGFKRKSTRP